MCYDPVKSEPVLLEDAHQQAFTVPLTIDDHRTKVKDLSKMPYNCVGVVLSFYKNSDIPHYGTGFLIGQDKVLTVAHNVYQKIYLNNPVADKVYFIPAANGQIRNQETIPVTRFDYCEEFARK